MKIIEIKGHGTKVVLREGRIEDEQSDIIVNWANQDLISGPRSFYSIHKKAGPALYNSTLSFGSGIREADAFMTNSSMLECKQVVHAIIPQVHKKSYLRAFHNIAATVREYKKNNLARTLSLYIPEEADLCLAGIYTFLLDLELKEVTILYLNTKEQNKIESFFEQYKLKHSIWRKVDRAIIEGMVDVYKKLAQTFKNYRLTSNLQKRISSALEISPSSTKRQSGSEER